MTKMNDNKLSNFIPISRMLFIHPFWKEKRTFSKLEAWLDLIVSARFEESEATELIDGKMISWKRGQFPASLRYLAERWQWSKTKVNNFIRLLENEQMIERLSAGGQTVLSLKNYEEYNGRQRLTHSKEPQYNNIAERKDITMDKRRTMKGRARDKINKDNKEEDILYGATAPVHSQEDKTKFKAFEEWILKNAPKVATMKQPFTIVQYIKLRKTLPKDQVKDLLLGMQNYSPLMKKNDSAYLTILNWAKRDYKQLKPANNAISTTAEYLRKREDKAEQARKRAED
jgi:hypothetical protein